MGSCVYIDVPERQLNHTVHRPTHSNIYIFVEKI